MSEDNGQQASEVISEEIPTEIAEVVTGLSPEATPAEVKAEIKKIKQLKLKVFGREELEDLPFELDENNPKAIEYMTKQLQLAKASQRSMQEKSSLEKEVGAFIEDLRKNPRKVLSDPRISVDLKKMAAEIIQEEIDESQKSPDQIQKEKLEARLKELEEERQKEKDEARERELARHTEQQMIQYDNMMTKALEKSDLPKSPYIVKKMADYMLLGLNNNIALTADDVVPMVREELQNDLKEMFKVMPDEVIEAIVGKEVFGRVRKKNVAKAKSAPPTPLKSQVKDTGAKAESVEKEVKKINMKDFFGM